MRNKSKKDSVLFRYLDKYCFDEVFKAIKIHCRYRQRVFEEKLDEKLKHIEVTDIYSKFISNVQVVGNEITFDAVYEAEVAYQSFYRGDFEDDVTFEWLTLKCKFVIQGKQVDFKILNTDFYYAQSQKSGVGVATADLIPIIRKEEFDTEAEIFLRKWYPAALKEPMPVPIRMIIEDKIGLRILDNVHITKKMSVFGQICFTDGAVQVFNSESDKYEDIEVSSGTILIDPNVFFLRNLGCVNNTLAHEIYHWEKHKFYAIINGLVTNSPTIAQRCATVPKGNVINAQQLSSEDWMEWQANGVAPKILMPKSTTISKIKSLMEEYDYTPYENNSSEILTEIICELADFFKVSKQAAKIRMIELGFPEAAEVLNYGEENTYVSSEISDFDGYKIFSEDKEFRELLELGLFIRVEDFYVINSNNYRKIDENGKYVLTQYAREHIDECTLSFECCIVNVYEENRVKGVLFRNNTRPITVYAPKYNQGLIDKALEEVPFVQSEIDKNKASGVESAAEKIKKCMERKKWNSAIFQEKTGLSANHYSKIKNNPQRKFELPVLISILVGLNLSSMEAHDIVTQAGYVLNSNEPSNVVYDYFLSSGKNDIYACNAMIDALNEKNKGAKIKYLGAGEYKENK